MGRALRIIVGALIGGLLYGGVLIAIGESGRRGVAEQRAAAYESGYKDGLAACRARQIANLEEQLRFLREEEARGHAQARP